MSGGRFRPATDADLARLLALQSGYYAEDGYGFDEAQAHRAWSALLSNGRFGRAWVAEADGHIVSYVVLALGFSLEYRGIDAFIDELFVVPAWRGRGLGTEALAVVEAACVELGVRALHLEVERDKAGAQALYRRLGFADHDRFLMTKPIGR